MSLSRTFIKLLSRGLTRPLVGGIGAGYTQGLNITGENENLLIESGSASLFTVGADATVTDEVGYLEYDPAGGTDTAATISIPDFTAGDALIFIRAGAERRSTGAVNLYLGAAGNVRAACSWNYDWVSKTNSIGVCTQAGYTFGALAHLNGVSNVSFSSDYEMVDILIQYDSFNDIYATFVFNESTRTWTRIGAGKSATSPYLSPVIRLEGGGDKLTKLRIESVYVCKPNFVAIGDSICEGSTGFAPDYSLTDFDNCWQKYFTYRQLRNNFVVNRGVGSENSSEIAARISDLLTECNPQAVFLHASSNDYGAGFTYTQRNSNISDSVTEIQAGGAKCVLLNSIYANEDHVNHPDSGDYTSGWWAENSGNMGADIKIDIMQPVIDVATGRLDTALAEADGIHPTKAGYSLIGEFIQTKI